MSVVLASRHLPYRTSASQFSDGSLHSRLRWRFRIPDQGCPPILRVSGRDLLTYKTAVTFGCCTSVDICRKLTSIQGSMMMGPTEWTTTTVLELFAATASTRSSPPCQAVKLLRSPSLPSTVMYLFVNYWFTCAQDLLFPTVRVDELTTRQQPFPDGGMNARQEQHRHRALSYWPQRCQSFAATN